MGEKTLGQVAEDAYEDATDNGIDGWEAAAEAVAEVAVREARADKLHAVAQNVLKRGAVRQAESAVVDSARALHDECLCYYPELEKLIVSTKIRMLVRDVMRAVNDLNRAARPATSGLLVTEDGGGDG